MISSWPDVGELIHELTTSRVEEQKAWRLILEIPSRLSMAFELRDGNGNEVVWPLTIISDTTPRT